MATTSILACIFNSVSGYLLSRHALVFLCCLPSMTAIGCLNVKFRLSLLFLRVMMGEPRSNPYVPLHGHLIVVVAWCLWNCLGPWMRCIMLGHVVFLSLFAQTKSFHRLVANDCHPRFEPFGKCGDGFVEECYLVDPASSHMLVSKIKPCMCKYEQIQTVKLRMAH